MHESASTTAGVPLDICTCDEYYMEQNNCCEVSRFVVLVTEWKVKLLDSSGGGSSSSSQAPWTLNIFA